MNRFAILQKNISLIVLVMASIFAIVQTNLEEFYVAPAKDIYIVNLLDTTLNVEQDQLTETAQISLKEEGEITVHIGEEVTGEFYMFNPIDHIISFESNGNPRAKKMFNKLNPEGVVIGFDESRWDLYQKEMRERNISTIERINDIIERAQVDENHILRSTTICQVMLETAGMTSTMCNTIDNILGHKCIKCERECEKHDDDFLDGDCFVVYKSKEECIQRHYNTILKGPRGRKSYYENTLECAETKCQLLNIAASGYATNPRYAEIAILIYKEYENVFVRLNNN